VLFWTVHYDPEQNLPHEKPLGSTKGCDLVPHVDWPKLFPLAQY
jgi:hypothetical protein